MKSILSLAPHRSICVQLRHLRIASCSPLAAAGRAVHYRLLPSFSVALSLCLCVFVVSISSPASGESPAAEQWLQYRFAANPWQYQVETGPQMMSVVTEAPGLALPDSEGADRCFAKWQAPLAKDGFVWAMFERSPKAQQHDTLYIDSDCDGAIDDEQPVMHPIVSSSARSRWSSRPPTDPSRTTCF